MVGTFRRETSDELTFSTFRKLKIRTQIHTALDEKSEGVVSVSAYEIARELPKGVSKEFLDQRAFELLKKRIGNTSEPMAEEVLEITCDVLKLDVYVFTEDFELISTTKAKESSQEGISLVLLENDEGYDLLSKEARRLYWKNTDPFIKKLS